MTWIRGIISDKKMRIAVLGCLCGLFLLLLSPVTHIAESDQTDTSAALAEAASYAELLEEKLCALLREVRGISEVHVLLTLEMEGMYEAADSDGTFSLVSTGSESVVHALYPQVRGVAIVCTRGNDTHIRLTVTELVSAALGISASRISVAGC